MSLAFRLKSTRKKHGLSQTELAERVNVSQPTIANWERGGHTPRPDALARISDVLSIDTTWLLSGELPARHDPANQYLAQPLCHIAVYDWPLGTTDPTESSPSRFIPLSTDQTGLFALEAHVSTGFPTGTTLIFARRFDSKPDLFLAKTAQGFVLTDDPLLVDYIFARLIYSIVPHE